LDAASDLKLAKSLSRPVDRVILRDRLQFPRAALERPDCGTAIADKSPQC
jgi:hypothetical protein